MRRVRGSPNTKILKCAVSAFSEAVHLDPHFLLKRITISALRSSGPDSFLRRQNSSGSL